MPKDIVGVTLGRAMIAIGSADEPDEWSFTGSSPSAVLLNHIAMNAKDKGFGVDDDGNVKQLATIWHMRQELAVFARDHADYGGDDNSFVVAYDEDRYTANHQALIAPFVKFNDMTLGDVALEHSVLYRAFSRH